MSELFLGFAGLQSSALLGDAIEVRRSVEAWQRQGLDQQQVVEGIAVAFLHIGPRGMGTVAEALDGYEWSVPDAAAEFPEGWAADPEAFRSGMDFARDDVTAAELDSLRDWHQRSSGEVPRYVEYWATYRPEALKAFRARYETCLQTLPKQVMPYTLLHYNVARSSRSGIRENVLLARGFGMTKVQTLHAITSALRSAGALAVSLVYAVSADIFEAWEAS